MENTDSSTVLNISDHYIQSNQGLNQISEYITA